MKLPTGLSGHELRRGLERIRFVYQRQRGSHMILRRADPYSRVVIPDHKVLRAGTLKQILHEAGISIERLREIL